MTTPADISKLIKELFERVSDEEVTSNYKAYLGLQVNDAQDYLAQQELYVPIIRLHKVEAEKFMGEEVGQETLEKIASKVSKVLVDNYYWHILEDVCRDLKKEGQKANRTEEIHFEIVMLSDLSIEPLRFETEEHANIFWKDHSEFCNICQEAGIIIRRVTSITEIEEIAKLNGKS